MPTPDPDDAIEPPRSPGYSVHVPEHLRPAPIAQHGAAAARRVEQRAAEPPAKLPEATRDEAPPAA